MKCKYVIQNQKEGKCNDYYISHSKGDIYMCRLKEWKQKKKVCPYNNGIRSCTARCKGQEELICQN